jgi:hypothetical protein
MIVILASRWDKTAGAIAACCVGRPVRIMTCQDLCTSGWRQRLGAHWESAEPSEVAVAGQQLIPQRQVTGVLTRLPTVTDDELIEIAPQDRGYVAAEMAAFLLFWLSRLSCPVLNRPTPMCLAGPFWRAEKWVHAAARAGIPVQPIHRNSDAKSRAKSRRPAMSRPSAKSPLPATSHAVTVIGEQIFGEADLKLLQQARRLAQLAEVAMLTVHFSGAERGAAFLGADTFPDLSQDRLKAAVIDTLCDSPTHRP